LAFLDELRSKKPELLDAIRTEKALSDAIDAELKAFFDGFTKTFA
jgi:F-type H+-transporting ATPase subunit alpha